MRMPLIFSIFTSCRTGMRRILIVISIAFCFLGEAFAGHISGGEITWECLGSGQFKFYLKLYRDCASASSIVPPALQVWNHPSVNNISLSLVSTTDISPVCNPAGPSITCAGATSSTLGSMEEYVYESQPITMAGVPPPEGWIITYYTCCRSANIVNLVSPQNEGFTLRAKMFAYNGQDMYPCYDNSPDFAEVPSSVLCVGGQFTYNNNAFDRDLDSLRYDWVPALDASDNQPFVEGSWPNTLPYVSPYSFDNAINGITLDNNSGEFTFNANSIGNFVTAIRVQAYKCGSLVAEVYREMQITITNCTYSNNAPQFGPTNYSVTVTADDVVNIPITITDNDTLLNGSPQTISLDASGVQFGAGFTNTSAGCFNAPCATLTPPPPASGQNQITTNFTWQTSCDHLSLECLHADASQKYTFVLRAQDDACPIPGITYKTITVTVKGKPTVEAPELRCVSVNSSGNTVLSWIPPIDTAGTFNNYQIYHSSSPNGPFTVIDSVSNINTTSYTHNGAGADAGPQYYYIVTKSGCYGQAYSNPTRTLSSIFLTVSAPPPGGIAALSWTPLATPMPSTTSGWYRIMKEFPAGTWTLLDSTQGLTYEEEIIECEAPINYRIDVVDNSGCTSSSNIDGDVFQDVTPPAPVEIDSVSVDPNSGFATISWLPSTSPDLRVYVVYKEVSAGSFDWVDSVYAPATFFHNTVNSLASDRRENYRVAAMDSCGNLGLLGGAQNTIYQTSVVDVCEQATTVKWNKYKGWPSGVNRYDIYASEDNGPYLLVGTSSPSDTIFVHHNDKQYATYCYKVRAVNGDETKTSTSNIQCIFTDIPKRPDFSYLNLVTVPETGGVEVNCYVDTSADIKYYEIYRSEDSLDYVFVDTTDFTGDTIITYLDTKAKSDDMSYFYRVVAVDSCGTPVDTTNFSKTVHLIADGEADRKNYLDWNAYRGFLGNVDSYNVYRSIDGVFDPTPLVTLSDGTLTYVDDVADVLEGDGEFCYYIEAVEGAGNQYGFSEISESNRACAYQLPNFFVPNAFAPEGFNQIFKPVTVYVAKENYIFQVYNSWGQKIFETRDIEEGWEGYMEGLLLPQGVYVYYFQYLSALGDVYEKRGTITLIK